jgi:hypothetical protein
MTTHNHDNIKDQCQNRVKMSKAAAAAAVVVAAHHQKLLA